MHDTSPLLSVVIILASCLCAATVLHRLRQPTILGFILGGVLVGPHVFHIVPYENVELLAEIGVGLLMFTIGLELSLQKLFRVKWISILGGSAMISTIVIITWAIARSFGWSPLQAFVIGCVIALSSTAVVLRLLADRGEVGSTHGNISTGLLLYQDIIAVPILTIIPIIARDDSFTPNVLFSLIGQFTVYVFALYAAAKFLVPKVLKIIAKTHSKELFSICVLTVCTVVAALAQQVGLSLALGAFLAGLIVSESDFGNQAASEILPLKEAFSAIFFATIGMLLEPKFFIENWILILASSTGLLFAKAIVTFAVTFLFRYPVQTSVFVGIGLCQIGEFSLLLLMVAYKNNIVATLTYQVLLADAILTIVATPYLLRLAPRIAVSLQFLEKISPYKKEREMSKGTKQSEEVGPEGLAIASEGVMRGHIILCGYGPAGEIVHKKIVASGLPVVIIDLNYRIIQKLKSEGHAAIYGDCSSAKVLEAANINHAVMLVVTIPDPLAMRTIVKRIHSNHPEIPILVRVKYNSDREKLISLGATDVVWEEFESGQELARRILSRLHFRPERDVEHTKDLILPSGN